MTPKSLMLGAAALAVAASPAALAEDGDYSSGQTFWNYFFPPKADHPVRWYERFGPYPLASNPHGFDDDFEPGLYGQWQKVDLAASTGAVCGNGSPYKFFVNRVPDTRNTLVYFEGGGACWDHASCSGEAGIRGARNRDGIPDDYVSSGSPATGLVSPFVFREHPYSRTKTQGYNLVYVPYCTGDVYAGDKTVLYEDPTGQDAPFVWHHNGVRNTRAVTAWLRDNLPRPTKLIATGCSAGGAGAFVNYAPFRRDMGSRDAYLINDSGPIFPTDRDGPAAQNPSAPLQSEIERQWGFGPVFDYVKSDLPGARASDYGTLHGALSRRFPSDRMGHVHFGHDQNYSAYSYERFYDRIGNETDPARKAALLTELWQQDTTKLQGALEPLGNYGYYFPAFRDVNESHCATIIDFEHGDVQEAGLELEDFVDSVLDGQGDVLEARESDDAADRAKPFNLIYALVGAILG